ncbi:MAG: hypothetical protein MN733_39685 [Nitrososphaera sp.]|nr:hypothetical protein [Nitrososphaera sp.]
MPAQRLAHRIDSLLITEPAVGHLATLPEHHRDPFDRIVVYQAIAEGLIILTPESYSPIWCMGGLKKAAYPAEN